jgi:hypothetical protein
VWDAAERGPYPLLHADARNVLAEIEIAETNLPAAVAAATSAYRLAGATARPSPTTTVSGQPARILTSTRQRVLPAASLRPPASSGRTSS